MTSEKIRQLFLDFFKKKRHEIVPSFSLLPSDSTVLFTTAGMQQFKSYFLGKKSPYGNRVVSCQRCFRTSDIEEIGDARHLTFFEMLGNFSFGDYFKEQAIKLAFEFLIVNCKLKIENLYITYFKGDEKVVEDKASKEIWQSLGIPFEKIIGFGRGDNFWGPVGEEGPCGPCTEIHLDLIGQCCEKKEGCLPNCECGRFVEIWNLVFNEYYQDKEGGLTLLEQKGVDTGMGLERLAMVLQNKNSVFETDLFVPLIQEIEKSASVTYNSQSAIYRIIIDHIKGSVFLIADGVLPSNVQQGYVLRRILRRAIRYGKLLNLPPKFLIPLARKTIGIYVDIYPELRLKEADILTAIQNEEERFGKTLDRGLKNLKMQIEKCKLKNLKTLSGEIVFDLFQSYGFPFELTAEIAKEQGFEIDKRDFEKRFRYHQEISRFGADKKFGGHGIEKSKIKNQKSKLQFTSYSKTEQRITKLHTATHLLHQALRRILGDHVQQQGSNITDERLRFDFSHSQKMTQDEIKRVEDLVNQKIREGLEVKREEMNLEDALRSGALAFFREKYPERVSVYTILNSQTQEIFSKEICAGPHTARTSELGLFKIIKEESPGAGMRRIKAILIFSNN